MASRDWKELARATVLSACMFGTVLGCGGSSGSPTSIGTPPVISQLQVQGALRVSGDQGVVLYSFRYSDPDSDIDRIVFGITGGQAVTNHQALGGSDGVAAIQQAVTLTVPGTLVSFTVRVLDGRNHISNTLSGSYVVPI